MASTITHVLVAGAAAVSLGPRGERARMAVVGAVCSVLPDADVVAFPLGFEYGHMLGHRGLSHSLLFAGVLAAIVMKVFWRGVPLASRRWWWMWLFFFGMTASHGVLDALTDGGLGIAFFSPFDTTRYFLPWRPLRVSPIGITGFFSEWGLAVLRSEAVWVWAPSALLMAAAAVVRGRWRSA